mmetsp:Transcript_17085/g.34582  ORF Transcript_17085/g.34582 Transcript_17085/m.34582 type:complete len:277 (+) Transcript_17085:441-1271(+)
MVSIWWWVLDRGAAPRCARPCRVPRAGQHPFVPRAEDAHVVDAIGVWLLGSIDQEEAMLRVQTYVPCAGELGVGSTQEDDEILPEESALAHVVQRVLGGVQLLRGEASNSQLPRSEPLSLKFRCHVVCKPQLHCRVPALDELRQKEAHLSEEARRVAISPQSTRRPPIDRTHRLIGHAALAQLLQQEATILEVFDGVHTAQVMHHKSILLELSHRVLPKQLELPHRPPVHRLDRPPCEPRLLELCIREAELLELLDQASRLLERANSVAVRHQLRC